MDTQNTPIHLRLWHHDFWRLLFANMLLAMSVYMLIPVLPQWLGERGIVDGKLSMAMVMGAYGVGLFVFGPFSNYLIQRYRRNHVCVWSMVALMLVMAGMWACIKENESWHMGEWTFVALRLLLGVAFGLAQIVFSSTLVIDATESFQRTEACHASAWFARFAFSLGPCLSLLVNSYFSFEVTMAVAIALLAGSVVLLQMVHFPFRAPDDLTKVVSTDRFFLTNGKWLFINLILITTVMGLIMTLPLTARFYAMLMGGFLIALLSEKYVFADADLKSEALTGMLSLGTSLLLMAYRGNIPVVLFVAPVLTGFGIGLIGSRFLLFFIKLSEHCQRGTSQSTFFLAWESGISLGLFLGYAFPASAVSTLLHFCLPLLVVSFVLYNFFVHPWYVKHKNR